MDAVVAAILPPISTVGLPLVIRPTWPVGDVNGASTIPLWLPVSLVPELPMTAAAWPPILTELTVPLLIGAENGRGPAGAVPTRTG